MRRSLPSPTVAVLASGLLIGVFAADAAAVHAPASLSDAETQCQLRSQYIMGGFTRRYAKCFAKCAQRAGTRAEAAANCPFAAACALGPANPICRCLTRARDQAVQGQVKRCSDCPECYMSGPGPVCSADAAGKASAIGAFLESLFFSGPTPLYCDDAGSVDGLHPAEAKCQQASAKALPFFARAVSLCHRSCRLAEHGGATPPGSCDPPITSNPNGQQKAKACIDRAVVKATLKIANRCDPVGGNPPECWGGLDAAGWIAEVAQFVDALDTSFFCIDP